MKNRLQITAETALANAGHPDKRAYSSRYPRPATTYRWFKRNIRRVHRQAQLAERRATRI